MEQKDRRPGLIGCGIVILLFGLMFAGFCALMALTFAAGTQAPARTPMPAGTLVYMSLFYLVVATLFVTLGMGSILARRWAPPLIQVVSWGWLLCGVGAIAMLAFMFPQLSESMPRNQPGAQAFAVGCMAITFGVFGIVVPLAFLLFYRSPHVKETVERLDPVPRWTDQHPVAILLFAAWMFFSAITVLLTTFMYRALPIGGFMLRGVPMFALLAGMATLMFWIGVGTLKRQRAAWWAAVALMLFGIAWFVLIGMKSDPSTMREAMGMPHDVQQEKIAAALYGSPFFYGFIAVMWTGYLAFLIYLRRYFFPRSERPAV